MGRISPGPTRWPPGTERRLVPAKSNLKPQTSKASLVGNPTPHAKERLNLHSSTQVQHGTDMYNQSKTEDGVTDEECSDMAIEYISLPKLRKRNLSS